jgi:hypothetical protein
MTSKPASPPPFCFAPAPVASAAWTQTVRVGRYERGQPFPADEDERVFANPDLNLWFGDALQAFDTLLAAQLPDAGTEVETAIREQRDRIAQAIAAWLHPVLEGEPAPGVAAAARAAMYDALKPSLAAGWNASGVAIVPEGWDREPTCRAILYASDAPSKHRSLFLLVEEAEFPRVPVALRAIPSLVQLRQAMAVVCGDVPAKLQAREPLTWRTVLTLEIDAAAQDELQVRDAPVNPEPRRREDQALFGALARFLTVFEAIADDLKGSPENRRQALEAMLHLTRDLADACGAVQGKPAVTPTAGIGLAGGKTEYTLELPEAGVYATREQRVALRLVRNRSLIDGLDTLPIFVLPGPWTALGPFGPPPVEVPPLDLARLAAAGAPLETCLGNFLERALAGAGNTALAIDVSAEYACPLSTADLPWVRYPILLAHGAESTLDTVRGTLVRDLVAAVASWLHRERPAADPSARLELAVKVWIQGNAAAPVLHAPELWMSLTPDTPVRA